MYNNYQKYDDGVLYFGDCLEIMPTIPKHSVNLILSDLPFGVTSNKEDIALDLDKLWEQYKNILTPDGKVVLFAQGLFAVDLINSNRNWFKYDLIWDKVLVSGHLNAKKAPLRQHEQILVFANKTGTYNPQMWDGIPLHSKGQSYKTKEMVNNNYNFNRVTSDDRAGETKKYPRSILRFQKPHPSKSLHRTEKDIKMLEYLIKTYSNENEIVLDNCCGSGPTLLAARNTKRKFIGIELQPNYFEISKNRLK